MLSIQDFSVVCFFFFHLKQLIYYFYWIDYLRIGGKVWVNNNNSSIYYNDCCFGYFILITIIHQCNFFCVALSLYLNITLRIPETFFCLLRYFESFASACILPSIFPLYISLFFMYFFCLTQYYVVSLQESCPRHPDPDPPAGPAVHPFPVRAGQRHGTVRGLSHSISLRHIIPSESNKT